MEQPGNIKEKIALRIKELRSERGMSLDKASAATGVSKAMLGQIERQESTPTVALLWKIADGFRVSFSTLLQDSEPSLRTTRSLARNEKNHLYEAIDVQTLFPFNKKTRTEVFAIEIGANKTHISKAHNPGITEYVVAIDGPLSILVKEKWYHLQKGEGLKFAANQEHGYRNKTDKKVLFHNIIQYS